jgi:hypothetical protein
MSDSKKLDPIEQERQLDANRAIAQKIRNRLQQLLNATENDKQRWIWELLQNAKDTVKNRQVDIEIIISADSVEFKHNGGYFTPRNVTNLVHQISSKEGEETVGRFGTGFLTTHTLSCLVEVSSVYFHDDKYYDFSILLDRQGHTEEELIKGIENSWIGYKKAVKKIKKPNTNWTSFKYINPNQDVAINTLKNFESSIFYNLAFVRDIGKITIKDSIENTTISFKLEKMHKLTDKISVCEFYCDRNNKKDAIFLLCAIDDVINIAIEVKREKDNYFFQPINESTPRLFCSFPLIGTEEFSFPFVINSNHFSPKTERDRLFLQGNGDYAQNNKDLLKKAVSLYTEVLKFASDSNWKNLYVIAQHELPPENDDFDRSWYKQEIQAKIREVLLKTPIVETEQGNLIAMLSNDGKYYTTRFPYDNKNHVRNKIWKYTFSLLPKSIPCERHIHDWYSIIKYWKDKECYHQDIDALAKNIENQANISKLSEASGKSESDTLIWLNLVFDFFEKEKPELFDTYKILPNQYGILKDKTSLYLDKGIPEELKDMLKILDEDVRDNLLHKDIELSQMNERVKNTNDILAQLDNFVSVTNQLAFYSDGFYHDYNHNKYTNEQYLNHQEKSKQIAFQLLGYSASKEIDINHKKIWEFSRSMYYKMIPEKITHLPNIEKYNLHKAIFKWILLKIANDISDFETVEGLKNNLHGTINPINWLNTFISFIQENEDYKHNIDLDEYLILPNQNGYFSSKSTLFLDDEIDKKLKEVLNSINPKWIDELLDTGIYYLELPENRVRKFEDISVEIDNTFRKYTGNKQDPKFIKALRGLLHWFKNQSDKKIKENFNWIYHNKAELSLSILGDDKEKDQIFQIIEGGNASVLLNIANNFTKNNLQELAENAEDIKQFLEDKKSGKKSVSKEDILNEISKELGEEFSSMDELKEKYKAKGQEVKIKLEPTGDSKDVDFEAISKSNQDAKDKVQQYLSIKSEYDISEWDDTSNTIISGVKKQGIYITLVIKGANNGTIYFDRAGKEKKELKKSFTELWVNNQGRVFQITLGKMIEDQNLKSIKTI